MRNSGASEATPSGLPWPVAIIGLVVAFAAGQCSGESQRRDTEDARYVAQAAATPEYYVPPPTPTADQAAQEAIAAANDAEAAAADALAASEEAPYATGQGIGVHAFADLPAAPLHATPDLYFANCSDARAQGYAPVYVGDPGYRPGLDRDGDGIGCES